MSERDYELRQRASLAYETAILHQSAGSAQLLVQAGGEKAVYDFAQWQRRNLAAAGK